MLRFLLRYLAAALILCAASALPGHASGTLPIALQQVMDANGRPVVGALLYIYQVGTVATPQNSFQDTALTNALPFPLQADANGRLPMFYLADGSVHVRLTDASGVVQFDYPSMMVIGSSGGGGGGGTVDPTALMSTGDIKPKYGTGPLPGFVRGNSLTIGSSTSGATERANSDCQALFIYLWTIDPNLAVSGGRGASALADWLANKAIATPDFRGTFIAGLDDMGASASGRLASLTTLGGRGGLSNYTIAQANLPNYNLSLASLVISSPAVSVSDPSHNHVLTDPTHSHTNSTNASGVTGTSAVNFGAQVTAVTAYQAATVTVNSAATGITISPAVTGITAHLATAPTVSGTLSLGGGGQSQTIYPPVLPVTVYLKL